MTPVAFHPSALGTVGIEVEAGLVDAETLDLTGACPRVKKRLGDEKRFKSELQTCILEVNTAMCADMAEAETDLRGRLARLADAAEAEGCRVLLSGTHPTADWQDQEISDVPRYHRLVGEMQWVARRLLTFGLHVHIGLPDGGTCVGVHNALVQYLPHLLALSANSPFWRGAETGLASTRIKVFENLPTAGLPIYLEGWDDYVLLVERLAATRSIETFREIWWDVRPHPDFGTIEVRICDLPPTVEEIVGLAALIQALVVTLAERVRAGHLLHRMHAFVVRQNKWRAARHGLDGDFIDPVSYATVPTRRAIEDLLAEVRPAAERLGGADRITGLARALEAGTGADRQRAAFRRTGDLRAVAREVLLLRP